MPEQENNYHIDEQLTQEGWQHMKALLDEEMPVEQERRRPLFWLWLAGAVGVAALAVVLLWPGEEMPVVNTTDTTEMAIAPITEERGTTPAKQQETVDSDSESVANTESSTAKTTTTSAQQSLDVPRYETEKTINDRPENSTTQNSIPAQQDNPVIISTAPSVTVSTNPVLGEETRGGSEELAKLPDEQQSVPEPKVDGTSAAERLLHLPVPTRVELSELSMLLTEKEPYTPTLTVLKHPRRKWFGWGVELGVQSVTVPRPNGFFAGAYATFDLNDRWQIATSLRYSNSIYTTFRSNNSVEDAGIAEPELDTTGLGTTFDPTVPTYGNTAQEASYNILRRSATLHGLAMPVAIRFRLNAHWSIDLGAQPSLLLFNTIKDKSLKKNLDLNNRGGGLNSFSLDSNVLPTATAANLVRRFDLAVRTGLHYQTRRHWGLGLHYNGVLFKNTGNQSNNSLLNSALQLSLNYRFR
ncbi:MAG: outer membrane beta-barrel protein [Bacteroidota bacterium]